jgi:CRP/FNR family transcriptional regulator
MKEELALKLSLNYPEFEEALVNEIIENASYKVFEAEEILLKSGEQIKNTMLILNGRVKIYREDDEGKEYFIYFLEQIGRASCRERV